MNTTMVASGANAVPPVVSSVQDIPLENIRESNSNPRRVFDEAQLRELAANIQLHGVLQAILVRPSQDGANGVYELVAGARRFRASKLAGKRTIPAAQAAFYDGKLSVAHGLEIARLQPGDQERALLECFPGHRSTGSILKDRKAEALTVRQLRQWIEREIHLDLKNAPFDTEDANLLPAAGACSACPKRTGNNPLLFPEIKNRSLCTDPACHQAKIQACVQLRVGPLAKEGKKPVQISESPSWQVLSRAPHTLYEGQYRRAEREGECPHTQVAVVVDGRKAGTVIHVCTDEKCKTHRQFSHYEISPQEREQRRKLALAVRVQKEARSRILVAVRQKLPAALARADFEMVALDYFRRLGHDNHHRLFQVYGGERRRRRHRGVGI